MTLSAAYLHMGETREPALFTPEASRRGRGIEVWAALRSLGRQGPGRHDREQLPHGDPFCGRTQRLRNFKRHRLESSPSLLRRRRKTRRVIRGVQNDGTCWCGGTEWHGRAAMRISVSCWATTEADVDQSLAAILRVARRRPVVVVDYDPEWQRSFKTLHDRIWPRVNDLAESIDHVGSTSVEGLAAKPVIDLYIVVPDLEDVPVAIERLRAIGYEHRGDLGIAGREAFRAQFDVPPHNLYVCHVGSLPLKDVRAFRDYLRAHADAVRAYAELKRSLRCGFLNDIDSYVRGKTEFVLGILELAGVSCSLNVGMKFAVRTTSNLAGCERGKWHRLPDGRGSVILAVLTAVKFEI